MSEDILKALMQLFAIVLKQDGGVEESEKTFVWNFLSQQLSSEDVGQYYTLFEKHLTGGGPTSGRTDSENLTSVVDSVRVLGICRRINKNLHQNQKIVVLARLFELVKVDNKITPQRMAIIKTAAEVFNVAREQSTSIEKFITSTAVDEIDDPLVMSLFDLEKSRQETHHGYDFELMTQIAFLHVPSVGLYFFRYTGNQELFLNGLSVNNQRIYLFATGSTVKLPRGKPVYYSDVVSHFLHEVAETKIRLEVKGLHYRFPGGNIGLQNINFKERHGSLVGIMGASGAGKTTLLNTIAGHYRPTRGGVTINGLDLHDQPEKLKGVIGFVPQDDLLIEELTVFQNLYYNARLCFRNSPREELRELVRKILANLGLEQVQDLKVGTALNKLISGGQRKRLNVALELLREPAVLFVDEPTTGLSSRDSENIMDLLRELALKGKLVFVVIHQPSSEIYKMFDRIIFIDTGGYLIFHGNPVEAVMYFKRMDEQINAEIGECPTCGNVYPELIFNIVDARVVDEFGNYTGFRKVTPERWAEMFREQQVEKHIPDATSKPPGKLAPPGWLRQFSIYWIRDLQAKVSNLQYLGLILLVSPLLALVLSYTIRYIADPAATTYVYRENENIPVYIFMSLIVSLFLGLIVSAEEIFRDRKILKREAFLNLSRSGYLLAKIFILMLISAIQSYLFVIIANPILGIKGMTVAYWLALFSTSVCANVLGLNISSAFNSAITIYIIIPMLMIPMMVLSGAMFSYDKLNPRIGGIGKVPWVAEFMIPKWSYEALMVHQFKENSFQKILYRDKKTESVADFHHVYILPELEQCLGNVRQEFILSGSITSTAEDLELLRNELRRINFVYPGRTFSKTDQITKEAITGQLINELDLHLNHLRQHFVEEFRNANSRIENLITHYLEEQPVIYQQIKDNYHNERIEEVVRKVYERNKLVKYRNRLIQQTDPIYLDPVSEGLLTFRSHFFAPRKYFLGRYFDTFWFNICFIWFLTILLYICLYYDLLRLIIRRTKKL